MQPSGQGDPAGTGYSTYGSIGHYRATASATRYVPVRISGDMGAGKVGTAYRDSLGAVNGDPKMSWSKVGGALPRGLRLVVTGSDRRNYRLVGKPVKAGTFTFKVRVVDAEGTAVVRTEIVRIKKA